MSRYHSLGKIPKKRHTTFKKADGVYTKKNYLVLQVLQECHHYYITFIHQL